MNQYVENMTMAAHVIRGEGPWMSFIETPTFTRYLLTLLDDEGYRELQEKLVENPETGPVIKKTGGARKLRWAAKGKGKSGGVRVIYYPFESHPPGVRTCFLLLIYPKNEKDSLTDVQKAALKKAIESLSDAAQAAFERAAAKKPAHNQ